MVSMKNVLRSQMVSVLKEIEKKPEFKIEKERKAVSNLHHLLKQLSITLKKEKLLLGAYHPIKSELNWLDLLKFEVCDLAFPAFMAEGEMNFFQAKISDLELSHEFGTKMMCPSKKLRVNAVKPDCLLVPGLAFNKQGVRLGRGAGYFDRYLENYHGVRMGICFAEQLRQEIPQDSHDQHMNFVVTCENIYTV